MKRVIVIRNQSDCREILQRLGDPNMLDPIAGTNVRDGIFQLKDNVWCVGTNIKGLITFWILEHFTKKEAWHFFDNIHGGKVEHVHSRMHFAHPKAGNNPNN